MEINEYKYFVSTQLKTYLATLSYKERVSFVDEIVKKADIKRSQFFNWKSMACRMPKEIGPIIESVAGAAIFSQSLSLVPLSFYSKDVVGRINLLSLS